jgi:hypothetical protein
VGFQPLDPSNATEFLNRIVAVFLSFTHIALPSYSTSIMEDSIVSLSGAEDVRPYRIHVSRARSHRVISKQNRRLTSEQVSSKYLELTRKKLELTRLPRELLLPRSREWDQGTPKSEIEPLIDFW